MINFIVDIKRFPEDLGWDYALVSGVEGDFSIMIDEKTVFNSEQFLIFEFFISFHRWVCEYDEPNPSGYHFASMDEEEEPIVAFNRDESTGLFSFDSVWIKASGRVTFEAIRTAHKELLVAISEQLLAKFDYAYEPTTLESNVRGQRER